MAIAFFDLDRTLIATNSATDWMRSEMKLGNIGRCQVVRAVGWIGLYQLGFARIESALHDAATTLAGQDEALLRTRTQTFWAESIEQTIRPGAHAVLQQHRAAGDQLVLLTSSSNYLGDAAAVALKLDAVLSNRFEVRDGVFTGRLIEPLCFGAGKLIHARSTADQHGVDLADCAFYTDSYSDLPVLEAVGRPVVVHPDPRLARHASKRGWPVVRWD